MKLEDKTALVTGGSRGIGRAIALAYAGEGAMVCICARTASEIEETAGMINAQGGRCHGWVCDVSSESSVEEVSTKVKNDFGKVDVLINNAGVMTRPAPTAEVEVKKWDYTIAVNLRGTFLVTRAMLPMMMRQRSGSIINVSSMIGRSGYANFAAYAASKWGIEGFTQTLAAEMRSYNVRVNSVDPGYVATKLTGYRGGKPESVTEVFVFLGADESEGISGKMLSSSGWRAQVDKK